MMLQKQIYKKSNLVTTIIQSNIDASDNNSEYTNKNIIDKLYSVFISNLEEYIDDYEIKRLRNNPARIFYKLFIKHSAKPLQEKIIKQYKYFKHIKSSSNNDKCYYIGETFGEIKHPTRYYENPKDVYVNLNDKTDKDLINLSIIKVCLEEDFVNYKLNNFFNLMLDLNLITLNEYNQVVMGTTNPDKIKLVNMGLSINLVNKLEEDEQLQNITYDSYGNLIRNENINAYINAQDEYTKFKFEKVFS